MTDPWAANQAIFKKVVGLDIGYAAPDITLAEPIRAIKIDEPADEFQGIAGKARRVSFEIQTTDLPRRPEKGDIASEITPPRDWSVIDIADRDDVGAWVVTVEDPEEDPA